MRLTYIGTSRAVVVPLPLGGEVTAKRGEPVLLPDSLAKRLLEQHENWKKKGAR